MNIEDIYKNNPCLEDKVNSLSEQDRQPAIDRIVEMYNKN